MSGKWHLDVLGIQTPTGAALKNLVQVQGGGDHWTHQTDLLADVRDGSVWPGYPNYKPPNMRSTLDLHYDRWVLNKKIKNHTYMSIFFT